MTPLVGDGMTPLVGGAATPLVEVRDLSKHFSAPNHYQVHAVEQVSLQIGRAETLAVVGESGCGKSTLAYLIMRLLKPSGGQILLGGEDITSLSNRALRPHRRRMQIIFQDPFASLDPRRRVGDAVAEPMQVHKTKSGDELRQTVGALFEKVGLEQSHMDQYPHQFSGGQRQRICIARALTLEPELVVADESVSALDVSIQAQVINLMMDLQDEMGLSYLFISHDLAVVSFMSDWIGVMYLGRLVEVGPAEQVFASPRHPYTRLLLDTIPDITMARRDREPVAGEVPNPINPPSGCTFHPRCPFADARCKSESPVLEGDVTTVRVACHAVSENRI